MKFTPSGFFIIKPSFLFIFFVLFSIKLLISTIFTARIRRMGKVMFSVCPHLGGVPISHNALQHFPECHGAAGGGTLPGPAGGGTLPGGVPCWGGYPAGEVPCRGGTHVRYPPGRIPPPSQAGGGTQLGKHREYLLHGGRYASCVHAGGLSCFVKTFHQRSIQDLHIVNALTKTNRNAIFFSLSKIISILSTRKTCLEVS